MSGISSNVPDTKYQMVGDHFVSPEGTTLSQQQFIAKVQSKEISLTEGSLKFLESQLGPELTGSMRAGTGYSVPPGQISDKLTQTEQVSTDIYALMELMAKMSQDQRKEMQTLKHNEFNTQIDFMKQSAEIDAKAGQERMWQGVMSGIVTAASGVISGTLSGLSTFEVGKFANVSETLIQGGSKVLEGGGQITTNLMFGGKISDLDQQSKGRDMDSKRYEQMVGETRDTIESLKEVQSKVKELLQAVQQAEDETNKSVARM